MKPPRLLLSLGLYTLLGFAPLAVNFLVLPVYAARLVPSEFGRLAVVNVAHTFLTLFIAAGIDAGYGRLYFDVDKQADAAKRLLVTVLTFAFLSGLFWAGMVFVAGDAVFRMLFHDVELAPYRAWLAFGTLAQVLYTLAYIHMRNGERLRWVALLSLSTSILSAAGVVVAIYWIRADAPTAFAARNLTFGLAAIPFVVTLFRESRPARPSWAVLRSALAFGFPVLSYSLIAYLLFNGDRLVMERWFLAEELGIYALAVTIVSPLEILLQAGQQAVQPTAYRLLNANDPGAYRFVSGVYSSLLAVCAMASAGVTVLGAGVAELAKGSKYAPCVRYLAILCFAQLFRVVFAGSAFAVFYDKRTRALPIVSVLSVFVGIGVAWLTRPLGTTSVAYGVVGWKAAQALFTHVLVRRELGPGKIPSFGASYLLVVLVGAWAIVESTWPSKWTLGGGAGLVIVASLAALAYEARPRWWRSARPAAIAPVAERSNEQAILSPGKSIAQPSGV